MDNVIEFGSIEKEISYLKMVKFINEVILFILEKETNLDDVKLKEIHDEIFDYLLSKEIKRDSFFTDYMIEVSSVSICGSHLNVNSFIDGLRQFECKLNNNEKEELIDKLKEYQINNRRK